MDKFPEAFKRFEKKVNIKDIDSFQQLTSAFSSWVGSKWIYTRSQMEALAFEAKKRRFDTPSWSNRGFSGKHAFYSKWKSQTIENPRSTAYQSRIERYMRNHPYASLAEARGHKATPKSTLQGKS